MTSLRHLDTTRVFAWLVDLFEDSHLNAGRRKRPVFSQTRYSRVNVQKAGHCGRRTKRKG